LVSRLGVAKVANTTTCQRPQVLAASKTPLRRHRKQLKSLAKAAMSAFRFDQRYRSPKTPLCNGLATKRSLLWSFGKGIGPAQRLLIHDLPASAGPGSV